MGIGKLAGVVMTAVLNLVLFLLSPIMGAVALPFSIGISVTLMKGMVKIAGALYVLMFGVLFTLLSPVIGIVTLVFWGAASLRIIMTR
jgi:hypothetical protein